LSCPPEATPPASRPDEFGKRGLNRAGGICAAQLTKRQFLSVTLASPQEWGAVMLTDLDTTTLMIAALAVGAAGFFGGLAMDGVLQEDGFGVFGNMLVLIAGSLIGVYLGAAVRLPLDTMTADAVRGVCGAFISLTALAVVKSLLRRFGF
jgi:uncharacterized membrane protein YeaQ/YmgE (transglycosylase-associated protein family)